MSEADLCRRARLVDSAYREVATLYLPMGSIPGLIRHLGRLYGFYDMTRVVGEIPAYWTYREILDVYDTGTAEGHFVL